jgi:hypothetical protein
MSAKTTFGVLQDTLTDIDPDIAVEVFILEALAGDRASRPPPSSDDPGHA